MPDETIELGQVETVLDGLSSPTNEQLMQAVRAYSERAVASAAAKRGLTAGGSLPSWWTVDSTPGAESFTLEHGGDNYNETLVLLTGDPAMLGGDGNQIHVGASLADADRAFRVDAWGGVTIGPAVANANLVPLLTLTNLAGATFFQVDGFDERMAFFGGTPAVKPTGVAVTAAGIHAALVTLGLIAA